MNNHNKKFFFGFLVAGCIATQGIANSCLPLPDITMLHLYKTYKKACALHGAIERDGIRSVASSYIVKILLPDKPGCFIK